MFEMKSPNPWCGMGAAAIYEDGAARAKAIALLRHTRIEPE
jgi:hypothetical protein